MLHRVEERFPTNCVELLDFLRLPVRVCHNLFHIGIVKSFVERVVQSLILFLLAQILILHIVNVQIFGGVLSKFYQFRIHALITVKCTDCRCGVQNIFVDSLQLLETSFGRHISVVSVCSLTDSAPRYISQSDIKMGNLRYVTACIYVENVGSSSTNVVIWVFSIVVPE